MSTRCARIALCMLAVATVATTFAQGTQPSGAAGRASSPRAHVTPGRSQLTAAPLTLVSQSPWVTPTQPWFNLSLGVGEATVPIGQLHVSLTFYSRLYNASQFMQATGAVPQKDTLMPHPLDVPVTEGSGGRVANTCVTVLRDSSDTPPPFGTGVCASGSPTLTLGCTPTGGSCGDVYPVSVALLRQGSSTPLARFTTFLTYQEPGRVGAGGALRVGLVVPATAGTLAPVAAALTDHRDVPTTLAVNPVAVQQTLTQHSPQGTRTLSQLAGLSNDQVLQQPYVPVDVAALTQAGLSGEILAQVARGDALLRQAGLRPSRGPWVDTVSNFNQGDASNLAAGVQQTGSTSLVLSDDNLSDEGTTNSTFAQPFTLALGHGSDISAVGANSALNSRFTAQPADPVLDAQQLLAGLQFVHFEDAFDSDPRGIVVVPPPNWQPSPPFLDTLLAGLTGNPALSAVTLNQLFFQVQPGGNGEPSLRRLQAGPASGGIGRAAAEKIVVARGQLASFSSAVNGHPAAMDTLSDALLASEARDLSTVHRTAALVTYQRAFDAEIGKISIATERTVNLTAGRAPIPITVLSATSYPLRVVMTLASDKFTFPNGNIRTLTLLHPTTSVRVLAQASTSGDRLPIDVTLRTPDGQLLIAHTVLTVQSTAISFVGVALTVLAGAVLLLWWARTWRRSRRRRRATVPSQ